MQTPLEGLDALAFAFDDLDADAHGVARAELGDAAALGQLLDCSCSSV